MAGKTMKSSEIVKEKTYQDLYDLITLKLFKDQEDNKITINDFREMNRALHLVHSYGLQKGLI